jgi:hypothetical protein
VNARTFLNETPIVILCQNATLSDDERVLEIVKLLVSKGADPLIANVDSVFAFHFGTFSAHF